MEIKGRDLIEGIPKTLTITDAEIREALAEPISVIVNAVRVALERTPPELSARTSSTAASCSPAAARLLKNLDKLLREETGLPVSVAEDPLSLGRARAPERCFRTSTCCGRSALTDERPLAQG